jgi:hypothetical protein
MLDKALCLPASRTLNSLSYRPANQFCSNRCLWDKNWFADWEISVQKLNDLGYKSRSLRFLSCTWTGWIYLIENSNVLSLFRFEILPQAVAVYSTADDNKQRAITLAGKIARSTEGCRTRRSEAHQGKDTWSFVSLITWSVQPIIFQ